MLRPHDDRSIYQIASSLSTGSVNAATDFATLADRLSTMSARITDTEERLDDLNIEQHQPELDLIRACYNLLESSDGPDCGSTFSKVCTNRLYRMKKELEKFRS